MDKFTLPTPEQIMATVEQDSCYRPDLQIAHDLLMLLPAEYCFQDGIPTDQYYELWDAYLDAGGSASMMNIGIDTGNWERHKAVSS